MSIIDEIIDSGRSAFGFKDTIFYKENSDLQNRYDALKKLNSEYPNNEELTSELYIIKKGLDGENEISYQLKKSHIGMYVLRDVKVKYEDLTAQIDYVIITPVFIYYVECKNLVGNITVTEKGDFIREFTINGRKIKKGIDSPLSQVEAQREVIRKIWYSKQSMLDKFIATSNFENYRRVLVVAANKDTILNTNRAPKDIKYKVIRADSLIRQIEYEIEHRDKKIDYFESKKKMEKRAEKILAACIKENIDYYEYYKNKFCLNNNISINDNLKEELIEFRTKRTNEMNIPAYYVFTNEELEKLVTVRPKTLEELIKSNILPPIKIKTHGEKIIYIINSNVK